jgi:chromosome partitioning protein
MKTIAIVNQKGGCGKTTTAINLASSLGNNGKRVLLIDLDPQAHASLGLNIDSQDSIYNVISNLTPRKLKIENIIKRAEDNFDVIPSNVLVGTLEQELSDEIGRELKLSEGIRPIQDNYDYILIDCPPSLGILTINAIRLSDELIIPVETSRFSMQGVEHLMDIVKLVRDRLNHQVKCRVLITMFDSRLRHSFKMLATFREKFRDMLFDTIIHINVKLKESAVMGKSVANYDKYCRGSKDYNSLAKEQIYLDKDGEDKSSDEILQSFSAKMQELVKEETETFLQTQFALKAPEAKNVYVTGSFNNWSLGNDDYRLRRENGVWKVNVPLKPGVYEYQFIVDGVWMEDPDNPRSQKNQFGDNNSLVEVKTAESSV